MLGGGAFGGRVLFEVGAQSAFVEQVAHLAGLRRLERTDHFQRGEHRVIAAEGDPLPGQKDVAQALAGQGSRSSSRIRWCDVVIFNEDLLGGGLDLLRAQALGVGVLEQGTHAHGQVGVPARQA